LDLPESVNSETKLRKLTQPIVHKINHLNPVDVHLSLSVVSSLGKDQPMIALYAADSSPNNLEQIKII